jgi:hypothetical protein
MRLVRVGVLPYQPTTDRRTQRPQVHSQPKYEPQRRGYRVRENIRFAPDVALLRPNLKLQCPEHPP